MDFFRLTAPKNYYENYTIRRSFFFNVFLEMNNGEVSVS